MGEQSTRGLTLSVIIPVYNERGTVREIVQRVLAAGVAAEIIIVDDGSDDGTRTVLRELEQNAIISVIYREINGGKGAAVREGLAAACGDLLIVQDADLEYDPDDIKWLLAAIKSSEAAVVYGSRFLKKPTRPFLFWNRVANRVLTGLTNLLYGSRLTDMETCYKLFRREVIGELDLQARAFEFEPEVTAKLLKRGIEIVEVPVNFTPRRYTEGKKIRMRDAIMAAWTLVKLRFTNETKAVK
jgi:glycosyltransferase involved in cell wall biosynthesis